MSIQLMRYSSGNLRKQTSDSKRAKRLTILRQVHASILCELEGLAHVLGLCRNCRTRGYDQTTKNFNRVFLVCAVTIWSSLTIYTLNNSMACYKIELEKSVARSHDRDMEQRSVKEDSSPDVSPGICVESSLVRKFKTMIAKGGSKPLSDSSKHSGKLKAEGLSKIFNGL
jgi:hypothetical protein